MVWFPEMAVPEMFLATSTDEMDWMHDVEHEREGKIWTSRNAFLVKGRSNRSLPPVQESPATTAPCCLPFHQGKAKPETAEQLMRSR